MKTNRQDILSIVAIGCFLLCSLSLAAQSNPEAADVGARPPASITVDATFAFQYLSTGRPPVLGAEDRLRFSTPLNTLVMETVTPSGVRARVTNIVVMEYNLDHVLNFEIGPEGNQFPLENNTMIEGLLELPLSFGTISFGRQRSNLGPSRLSSLLISDSIPYLDSISLDIPLGRWRLQQVIAALENRLLVGDVSPTLWAGTGTQDTYGSGNTIILFSSRRFSWTGEWLQIALGANAILTRVNNAFTLGDILPVFSIHQGDVGVNNLSTMLDVTFLLAPELNVYLMGGLDDVNANDFGVDDAGIPTIWAWLAGGYGSAELGPVHLSYDVEAGSTHYLWGSYNDEYALSRAIYRLWTDNRNMLLPLTSRFGPGRTHGELRVSAEFPTGTRADLHGVLLFGDPAIDLGSLSYVVQEYSPQFMLFRMDLSAEQTLPFGFSVNAGVGFDLEPAGITPRFLAGVQYQVVGRLNQERE